MTGDELLAKAEEIAAVLDFSSSYERRIKARDEAPTVIRYLVDEIRQLRETQKQDSTP